MRKDRNILCIFAEYMSMKFTLQHKDPSSHARAGELHTDHGVIRTPIFMPVGTAATVKGIFHRDVRDEARAQIILANTYHLYLRPGMEILERAGGVHRFSTWEGPMLTDSGGFQVFSLAGSRANTPPSRSASRSGGSTGVSTSITGPVPNTAITRRCSPSCRDAPTRTCAPGPRRT